MLENQKMSNWQWKEFWVLTTQSVPSIGIMCLKGQHLGMEAVQSW